MLCLSIVAFESQSLTSVSVLNKRTLMSFNNTYSWGEGTCRLLKDVFNLRVEKSIPSVPKETPNMLLVNTKAKTLGHFQVLFSLNIRGKLHYRSTHMV